MTQSEGKWVVQLTPIALSESLQVNLIADGGKVSHPVLMRPKGTPYQGLIGGRYMVPQWASHANTMVQKWTVSNCCVMQPQRGVIHAGWLVAVQYNW